jgi:GAF domain-containing protein
MSLFLSKSIDMTNKSNLYKNILSDIENIIDFSVPTFANLGNISALLKSRFNWFWVGFYKVEGDYLILNAFQGPVACVKIMKGKGVCGKSWEENKSIVVQDVDLFEGHIVCNEASKSEIVIPIRNKMGEITYVLDVDHDSINTFDELDEKNLSLINDLIVKII